MSSIYAGRGMWGTHTSVTPLSIKRQNYNSQGNPTTITNYPYPNAWSTKLVRLNKSNNKYQLVLQGRALWRSPSSYTRSAATCTYEPGTWVRKSPVTDLPTAQWTGSGGPMADSSLRGPHLGASYNALIPGNMSNRLNTEVLLKLKDMKVNFGEALAEMKSTVSHLAGTGSSVLQAFLAARRGNWAGVAKALRVKPKSLKNGGSASERWLEYQFGWMPLLSDIQGGYELARDGFKQRGLIFSASKSFDDTVEFGQHNLNWDIEGSSTVNARIKIYASIDSQRIHTLTNLGLADPLLVGWAVLPYSFVIDWFMPVGNMLEAVGATNGLTFVGGFRSSRVNVTNSWIYRPENQALGIYEGEGFAGKFEASAYTRTKLTTFPIPSLYLKSPFSTSHVTSALALFRQAIKLR